MTQPDRRLHGDRADPDQGRGFVDLIGLAEEFERSEEERPLPVQHPLLPPPPRPNRPFDAFKPAAAAILAGIILFLVVAFVSEAQMPWRSDTSDESSTTATDSESPGGNVGEPEPAPPPQGEAPAPQEGPAQQVDEATEPDPSAEELAEAGADLGIAPASCSVAEVQPALAAGIDGQAVTAVEARCEAGYAVARIVPAAAPDAVPALAAFRAGQGGWELIGSAQQDICGLVRSSVDEGFPLSLCEG
jgi:hypothetical protein